MPLVLAFTDSLGYVDQDAAEAAGWTVDPGGGRVTLSFNEDFTVDGQNPSMLVVLNGWNVVGTREFIMSRSFEMAPNSVCGVSLADVRLNCPWFESLVISITSGGITHGHSAASGMVTVTSDATGIVTARIKKDIGYPYVHVDEQYHFANFRLYGTLIGDVPPEGAPDPNLPPLLFTPDMNWVEPLVEELEFETAITPFYADTEVREGLLDFANRRLTYLISATNADEAALVEALIFAGQTRTFWVPYWRGATWLNTGMSPGNATLAIDTLYKYYDADHGVMFWRDAFHAEVAELSAVTDSLLSFSPLVSSWAAAGANRAKVVPVYRGIISPSVPLDYIERSMKQLHVTFDLLT